MNAITAILGVFSTGKAPTEGEIEDFNAIWERLPNQIKTKLLMLAKENQDIYRLGFLGFIESAYLFHNITKRQYIYLRALSGTLVLNRHWRKIVLANLPEEIV